MTKIQSHGKLVWDTTLHHLQEYQHGPMDAGPNRSIIWGITSAGNFVGGMTADKAFHQAAQILKSSGRLYLWNDTVCSEVQAPEERLSVIATHDQAQRNAAAHLARFFCVGVQGEKTTTQSLPPPRFVNALLIDPAFRAQLPAIKHYSRRPLFDASFELRGPGWHQEQGILIHGSDISPIMPTGSVDANLRVIERLPLHLRGLLREFCFRTDADLVNTVALLLTEVLCNHFVDVPHPVGLIDGNQCGVGKTLLVQCIGRVLDGSDPPRISYSDDVELEKRLCTHLLEGQSSIIFLDNVCSRIKSALLDQKTLEPYPSFRLLGTNTTIRRPNTHLWIITSNTTTGTEDFIDRCLPVQLYHEGDPTKRSFSGKPLDYAAEHRLQILGELAGMILHWKQQGMSRVPIPPRCDVWSHIIGGVLQANALGGLLLTNVQDVVENMDEGLQSLATIAEYVVTSGKNEFYHFVNSETCQGRFPKDFVPLFEEARVCQHDLASRTSRGKYTWAGNFLSGKTDRAVSIDLPSGRAEAVLRKQVRKKGNQKTYYFEIRTMAGDAEHSKPADPMRPVFGVARPGEPAPPEMPLVKEQDTNATTGSGNDSGVRTSSRNAAAGNNLDWF